MFITGTDTMEAAVEKVKDFRAAVRQPPAGAADLRRLDREEAMKTAIVNLGTIVTGDWRDPLPPAPLNFLMERIGVTGGV